MKNRFRPALAGFFVALLLPALAFAAEAVAPAALDFGPLVSTLVELLTGAVAGFGLWLGSLLRAKLKIEADSAAAQALDRAIGNAITYGLRQTQDLVAANLPPVRLENELVASAARYVIDTMPDTIKRFGLTQDRVQQLVLARLPGGAVITPHPQPPAP
jgi:hypothetical protein